IYDKCNGEVYNPTTHNCTCGALVPRCGSSTYDEDTHFCSGTTIYEKCSGEIYNPSEYYCTDGALVPRCGNATYDEDTHFCSGTTIREKCGGEAYNISTHNCCSGVVYNTSTQSCVGNAVLNRCGTYSYDPATYFCFNSTVHEKCNGKEYNPEEEECVGNAIQIFFEDFEETATTLWSSYSTHPNYWIIGTDTYSTGSKAAYISDNNSSNNYTTTSANEANLVKHILFTASATNYTLSFDWKANGESNHDYMTVYLVPNTVSVSSMEPASEYRIASTTNFSGRDTWTKETITLPAATYSGERFFLLFRWQNNNTGGAQPPAAIDNILITR
ncbi:MAG: hypothetical protein FWH22_11295, partial [Fibromonadales bacterium]|nr:hypothetical protein [Fibromonadales bacterium]